MKISELTTRESWYKLTDYDVDIRDRSRRFIAVSEQGWERCLLQMAPGRNAPGPYNAVLGFPVVKVTDIADDEIEMRLR